MVTHHVRGEKVHPCQQQAKQCNLCSQKKKNAACNCKPVAAASERFSYFFLIFFYNAAPPPER
jgi:hypothetical protein